MTVKELIEILKGYEQDSEILVWSITENKFVKLTEEGITETSKFGKLFIDADVSR